MRHQSIFLKYFGLPVRRAKAYEPSKMGLHIGLGNIGSNGYTLRLFGSNGQHRQKSRG
jgi:hypothetical protein